MGNRLQKLVLHNSKLHVRPARLCQLAVKFNPLQVLQREQTVSIIKNIAMAGGYSIFIFFLTRKRPRVLRVSRKPKLGQGMMNVE